MHPSALLGVRTTVRFTDAAIRELSVPVLGARRFIGRTDEPTVTEAGMTGTPMDWGWFSGHRDVDGRPDARCSQHGKHFNGQSTAGTGPNPPSCRERAKPQPWRTPAVLPGQFPLRMKLSIAPVESSVSVATLASSTLATMICPTSVLTSENRPCSAMLRVC